ncbi:hypothetical protein GCM10010398_49320 [Streptomyces fimbriatus]
MSVQEHRRRGAPVLQDVHGTLSTDGSTREEAWGRFRKTLQPDKPDRAPVPCVTMRCANARTGSASRGDARSFAPGIGGHRATPGRGPQQRAVGSLSAPGGEGHGELGGGPCGSVGVALSRLLQVLSRWESGG